MQKTDGILFVKRLTIKRLTKEVMNSVDLHELSRRQMKLHWSVRAFMMKNMPHLGLHHGQLPILEFIKSNPGCTQQEIAEMLDVSSASIAQSTKRLQRDGFIRKKTDEENLRKNRLTLTKRGIDTAENCRRAYNAVDNVIYGNFSEEELICLRTMFDCMINNFKQNEEKLLSVLNRITK